MVLSGRLFYILGVSRLIESVRLIGATTDHENRLGILTRYSWLLDLLKGHVGALIACFFSTSLTCGRAFFVAAADKRRDT